MAVNITFNAMIFQRFIEEMLTKRNEDPEESKVPLLLFWTTILSIMQNKFKHTSNLQKYHAWE